MHTITYSQALLLGLLQGISELFPVSSLGHSVILPHLLGWKLDQNSSQFLTFLVATHFATALVLIGFFFKDWLNILKGMGQSFIQREIRLGDMYGKLGWLLVVGTVPAGILGLLFQDSIRSAFASSRLAAGFLILNGIMLLLAERLRKPKKIVNLDPDLEVAKLNWWQAIGIGSIQALALIPGLSRSGASMSGGLLAGLDNEGAARFAFLLATPIILAAALLKLPELLSPSNHSLLGPALVGAVSAGLSAYLAVRFLTRYFQSNSLKPFAYYCLIGGMAYSLLLH